MVIPIMRGDQIVAIIGVGNKPTDYDHRDVEIASLMDDFSWEIVERKMAQIQLEELLELNSKIVANSTQGIIAYRNSGECIFANEAAAACIGATVPQMLEQNFRQLASWKSSGLYEASVQAIEAGDHRKVEIQMLTTFGKEVWLDCDCVPFFRSGESHLLLIIADVSSFRHAEQALREAKLLADKNSQIKSEFLANISHEIRTPMNAIIGLSQFALDTDLNGRQRDYLSKILTSSKALLKILNDILDYSKIEAGRLDLEEIDFDLDEVFENIANLFSVKAEGKGLGIFFQATPEVPAVLTGDPLRLGQVLNNLVGNAVKFTNEGEIHTKVELVEKVDDHCVLKFSVRDTGIGLPPEQSERLFQAFSQADGSIIRKYGGSGLGLAISKHLVELLGGEMGVESEAGKGSTFHFTAEFRVNGSTPIPRDPNNLRGMRVLVVDDQETSRMILREILESWAFRVVTDSSLCREMHPSCAYFNMSSF